MTQTEQIPTEAVIHNACILYGDRTTFAEETADTWIAIADGTVAARGRGDRKSTRLNSSHPK